MLVMKLRSRPTSISAFVLCVLLFLIRPSGAQQPGAEAIVRGIDASAAARESNLIGYTVIEHYTVFRDHDEQHAAAAMTVKATYRKDVGKAYQILSESGSQLLRSQLLERMLDSEKAVTKPAVRAGALIDSGNYRMTWMGGAEVDGRRCFLLQLVPKRSSPYLFKGRIWVDGRDESIVRLEGITAKSPTVFAAPTHVTRQYARVDGFPMATHATASTSIWLIGPTTIQIDYSDYAIQAAPSAAGGEPSAASMGTFR